MKLQELLNKPTFSPAYIADHHGVDISVILSQLKKGINVELEHTSSIETAREIALDHLLELPDYYSRLDNMEKGITSVVKENKLPTLPALTLKTDNPGGQWLADKQEDTVRDGKRPSGRYKTLGSVTGWYNREAFLPVKLLAKIPGTNSEQSNVRQDDLDWLVDFMGKNQKLPDADWHEFNEYAPMVVIGQDGIPYVNEGNHRIMAAVKLGFTGLPVEIKYYNGGEQQNGILSPQQVQKYDHQAKQLGISYGSYKRKDQ